MAKIKTVDDITGDDGVDLLPTRVTCLECGESFNIKNKKFCDHINHTRKI